MWFDPNSTQPTVAPAVQPQEDAKQRIAQALAMQTLKNGSVPSNDKGGAAMNALAQALAGYTAGKGMVKPPQQPTPTTPTVTP